jgi:hypothetical protein
MNRRKLSAPLYALHICRLTDVSVSKSLHHYIYEQNQCQVEAKNSVPYRWAPGTDGASGATGYFGSL